MELKEETYLMKQTNSYMTQNARGMLTGCEQWEHSVMESRGQERRRSAEEAGVTSGPRQQHDLHEATQQSELAVFQKLEKDRLPAKGRNPQRKGTDPKPSDNRGNHGRGL